MRLRIAFLALAAAIPAMPQTTSPTPPLLNTGLPNAYPTERQAPLARHTFRR